MGSRMSPACMWPAERNQIISDSAPLTGGSQSRLGRSPLCVPGSLSAFVPGVTAMPLDGDVTSMLDPTLSSPSPPSSSTSLEMPCPLHLSHVQPVHCCPLWFVPAAWWLHWSLLTHISPPIERPTNGWIPGSHAMPCHKPPDSAPGGLPPCHAPPGGHAEEGRRRAQEV